MALPLHDQRIGRQTHDDGGHTVEHVRGKAHRIPECASAAILRKVHTRPDAQRDAEQTGQAQDYARSRDGVGHAAAGLADRHGDMGEEGPVQRTRALVDQVSQDGDQRQQHNHRADDREHRHQVCGKLPPQLEQAFVRGGTDRKRAHQTVLLISVPSPCCRA